MTAFTIPKQTDHKVDDTEYVVDHETKEVFSKEKITIPEEKKLFGDFKLRKTGGDYQVFLSKLPAEERAKFEPPAPPEPEQKPDKKEDKESKKQ